MILFSFYWCDLSDLTNMLISASNHINGTNFNVVAMFLFQV